MRERLVDKVKKLSQSERDALSKAVFSKLISSSHGRAIGMDLSKAFDAEIKKMMEQSSNNT